MHDDIIGGLGYDIIGNCPYGGPGYGGPGVPNNFGYGYPSPVYPVAFGLDEFAEPKGAHPQFYDPGMEAPRATSPALYPTPGGLWDGFAAQRALSTQAVAASAANAANAAATAMSYGSRGWPPGYPYGYPYGGPGLCGPCGPGAPFGGMATGNMGNANNALSALIAAKHSFLLSQRGAAKGRIELLGFPPTTVPAFGTVTITTQPQVLCKIYRIVIPSDISTQFLVHEFKVGKWNLFANGDPVPAAMLDELASDIGELNPDTAQVNSQVSITVENITGAEVNFRCGCFVKAVEGC